ncbi:hypothetical protein SSAG_00066 [Streptomyces sp. Mg1]|nr:hypothetical protein SSAG_00066 [Streptomyces sp. Mg1]
MRQEGRGGGSQTVAAFGSPRWPGRSWPRGPGHRRTRSQRAARIQNL